MVEINKIFVGGGQCRPVTSNGYLNDATIAYYPLATDLFDHKTNGKTLLPLTANGSLYTFTTNTEGKKCVKLDGNTYFSPGSGNVWGIDIRSGTCTIAFRVCGYTSPSYGSYGYSGNHSGIINFSSGLKTGVSSDGSVGRDVGILDDSYEGFNADSGYTRSTSTTPPTMNGYNCGQAYLDNFISVVDIFNGGKHTRYYSTIGSAIPYFKGTYSGSKNLQYNYIGWDNYGTASYRYYHGYMKDIVIAGDNWTSDMIQEYFDTL